MFRRAVLVCLVSQSAARNLSMPYFSDWFLMVLPALLIVFAAYGVGFYVVYLFYKQLRGIRQALDRIADRDAL